MRQWHCVPRVREAFHLLTAGKLVPRFGQRDVVMTPRQNGRTFRAGSNGKLKVGLRIVVAQRTFKPEDLCERRRQRPYAFTDAFQAGWSDQSCRKVPADNRQVIAKLRNGWFGIHRDHSVWGAFDLRRVRFLLSAMSLRVE